MAVKVHSYTVALGVLVMALSAHIHILRPEPREGPVKVLCCSRLVLKEALAMVADHNLQVPKVDLVKGDGHSQVQMDFFHSLQAQDHRTDLADLGEGIHHHSHIQVEVALVLVSIHPPSSQRLPQLPLAPLEFRLFHTRNRPYPCLGQDRRPSL